MEKSLTTAQAAKFLEIGKGKLREYREFNIGPPYFVLPPLGEKDPEKRNYVVVRYLLSDLVEWVLKYRIVPNPGISGVKRRRRIKWEAKRLIREEFIQDHLHN